MRTCRYTHDARYASTGPAMHSDSRFSRVPAVRPAQDGRPWSRSGNRARTRRTTRRLDRAGARWRGAATPATSGNPWESSARCSAPVDPCTSSVGSRRAWSRAETNPIGRHPMGAGRPRAPGYALRERPSWAAYTGEVTAHERLNGCVKARRSRVVGRPPSSIFVGCSHGHIAKYSSFCAWAAAFGTPIRTPTPPAPSARKGGGARRAVVASADGVAGPRQAMGGPRIAAIAVALSRRAILMSRDDPGAF